VQTIDKMKQFVPWWKLIENQYCRTVYCGI